MMLACATGIGSRVWFDRVATQVSSPVLEKLGFGNRKEGVVAVAEQPSVDLSRLPDSEEGLILVIDRVEKPGNLGAMVRTADAAGATAVLMSDPVCDIWNSNASRASLCAIFRMPIGVAEGNAVVDWLGQHGYQMVAARVDGSEHYRDVTWSKKVAIIVGSEATGLDATWNRSTVTSIRLPMRGTVDSLNVSVTAAILLYEAAYSHRLRVGGLPRPPAASAEGS